MKGYLDALVSSQDCAVVLAGETRRVPRARLGLHLRLARVEERVGRALAAGDAAGAAEGVRCYLDLAGVAFEGAMGAEMLIAYLRLAQVNALQWALPFMLARTPPEKPPAYDYVDRVYAWWVHKLASRYGWTRDEIMDLWPEEVACYLQEIAVAEYDEADERRALSELSYAYDKQTKRARFRPLPRPAWMIGMVPRKGRRVRRDMLPIGVVIELGKE